MHDEQHFDARLTRYSQGGTDRELTAHIAGCESCRESLFVLQQLLRYGQTTGGGIVEPPAIVINQASSMFSRVRPDLVSRQGSVSGGLLERVREIVATLIVDTGATPTIAGLRGQADRRTRQLAFVSDVVDLDLEVSRTGETCSIAGQLGMDHVPAGLKIRFVPADRAGLHADLAGAIEADVLELGHFTVSLPAADWVAFVEIDDAIVLFPGVQL